MAEPAITPREPKFPLDEPLPRHWLAGNAVATAIANGVNLLFPAGERFFVRSVSRYLGKVRSPELRERAKAFFAQEGHHARAHERIADQLESHGYRVHAYLRAYEAIAYGFLERVMPKKLGLATTAACEHFTALLAEDVLRSDFHVWAHPTMTALFRWHAAEEIEHRSVAFDVLQDIAPGYAWRMSGLFMATVCLGGFWFAGSMWLLWNDRRLGLRRLGADWRAMQERRTRESVFGRGIRAYLRRDFHPSRNDLDALAQDYLRSVGMAA
jgi:predicted metal-dependent hydrolase